MKTSSTKESGIELAWLEAEKAAKQADHNKVMAILKRLDELGVWQATARIGEFYETGAVDLPKNADEAVKWYRKAVFESDDPLAHLGLGRIYYEGSTSVQQDYSKARTHLEKAFAKGLHQAGIYLGIMNMFGVDRERDLPAAEFFFLSAARAGFPVGYRYLANISASSGHFFRTIGLLCKEAILSIKLKIIDRNHPNLWRAPK